MYSSNSDFTISSRITERRQKVLFCFRLFISTSRRSEKEKRKEKEMKVRIVLSSLVSYRLCLSSLSFFLLLPLWILTDPTAGKVATNDVEIVDGGDVCNNLTRCDECISASPSCSWCKHVKFVKIRCDTQQILLANGCPSSDIVNPKTERTNLEDLSASDGVTAVQMKPQKVKLRLRPNEKAEVPFKFYLAQDTPVDMYFVMDLSNTMKIHIKQLAKDSKILVDDIRGLTKYLKVGIGSFVDKTVLPYTLLKGTTDESKSKYDFKQMIKLTDQFQDFQNTVDNLENRTTDNLDTPEAGLDAVMQSIVCEEKIGWRKGSRRLIIYSSDAPFHFGGDGKLGGIVIPNDGECHLKNNKYTKDRNQDYPSVGQIVKKIQDNHITVIFTVSSERLQTYQNFVKNIRGAYVSELNSEKSTIAEIVKKRFKSISSRVEMISLNKDVVIQFMSNCSGSNWTYTKVCENLKPKQTVDFKALIPAQKCPPGNRKKIVKKKIVILPNGLNQNLEIELELICGCDCTDSPELMSPNCNRLGNLTCGKCFCDYPKVSGECQLYNTTTICSDQGSCDCGKCFCKKIPSTQNYYNGEYCECNDYSCQNFNGTLCGGLSHGKCKCGTCQCNSEFKGENCGCPIDTSACLDKNGKICNGHGKCVCGACKCDKYSGYKGKTCETCPTCGQCDKFVACVKCAISHKTNSTKECAEHCQNVEVEIVKTLDDKSQWKDEKEPCVVEINDCYIRYINGIEKLAILEKQECKKEIDLVALIAGIIGGIFFIGLVLLILWKIITTYQDRREVARLELERAQAKWNGESNPLYVRATTTFRNPMCDSNQDL